MSDDIVKELRESKIALHSTAHKAADEIEKMREELDAYDDKTKELCDEITRLRADLAAVTAERDRMRTLLTRLYDAAGPLDADKMPADDFAQIITIVLDAHAALEGVTKKEGEEYGNNN